MYAPKPAQTAPAAQPIHIKGAEDFQVIVWHTIAVVAGVWALSMVALAVVAHARGVI